MEICQKYKLDQNLQVLKVKTSIKLTTHSSKLQKLGCRMQIERVPWYISIQAQGSYFSPSGSSVDLETCLLSFISIKNCCKIHELKKVGNLFQRIMLKSQMLKSIYELMFCQKKLICGKNMELTDLEK